VELDPTIKLDLMQPHEKKKTPAIANWLASKFINAALLEEFFGDLKEIYEDRISTKGRVYAKFMYWVDVLHLVVGFASFKLFKSQNNTAIMQKHYLLIAIRNLARTKIYSIINILSLAVGMGVCLAIGQYIYFELSYDKFHNNFQNIYRITNDEIKPDGELYPYPYETGYAVGVAAKEEIREIKQYARMHKYSGGSVVSNSEQGKIFTEDAMNMFFVDKTFLQVFNFPLKVGKKESAFDDKYNIVITEKATHKYFDSDDAMGKVLTVSGGISPGNYTVTGILKDLPLNTHLQFDFLMPVENYMEYGWGGAAIKNDDGWTSPDFATYAVVDESADLGLVEEKLDQLIAKHTGHKRAHKNISQKAGLQPIKDIHLKSDANVDQAFVRNNGNIVNVKFFSIIAFFILLVAWVNYINLSTARSMRRAKEVGIRKSIGAFRKQLIGQFITESFVVNLVSAILSTGIAALILPILGDILDRELDFSLLQIPIFWAWFLVVIVFGSLLSGSYPAFILSSFKPLSMLGAYKDNKPGKFTLRKGLITFQFAISLLLISGTYLVYKQITFMKNQEMGMEIEKILVLKGPEVNLDRTNLESTLQSFTEKAADHHSIGAVAASSSVPGKGYNTGIAIRKLGAPATADKFARVVFAGFDLPVAYDLEFVAGKSPAREMLNGEQVVVVINEEAVRAFELGSAENAVHEKLYYKQDTFAIAGVVKNFHWHSLADAHTPYLFEFYNNCRSYFSFKMNLSNIPESLAHIESTYNSFFPGNPFDYFFLKDEFNRQYQSDVQFGNLFLAFTVLAIFIACIGLFALISYSATLKIKEIGIRKVMGASTNNLMIMLSREYFILLLIANVLAIPAILYGGANWLDNYAFRTDLSLELFLIPGLILVIISFLTVSYQTYIAARTNPVESLRAE
jgi:putative ABC transport system permease protein